MNIRFLFYGLISIFLFGCKGQNAASDSPKPTNQSVNTDSVLCVIEKNSIGAVVLGDSIKSVKDKSSVVNVLVESDAEGVSWAILNFPNKYSVSGHGSGLDSAKEVSTSAISIAQEQAKFNILETTSSSCKTKSGVYVGMTLLEAEKLLGKVLNVKVSEIESREYVTFERNKDFIVRTENVGEYRAGSGQMLPSDAKIVSIGVGKF